MDIITQKDLPQWAKDYLHYIQIPIKEPSLPYLTEICTAHLKRIPFENISTLLQYDEYHQKERLIQDERRFVRQLYQYQMGGTCYMINSSFQQLLKQLGFQSRYAFLGGGHVALLVQLPNGEEEMYVDPGNGAPFFEPIHLETAPMNCSQFGGIEVRIRPMDEPGVYKYYRYVDGKLLNHMLWSFDTRKVYQFDDFQPAIQRYFQPNGFFTSDLRCQIWQLDQNRSLSLVNNMLSIRYSNGKVEKRELANLCDVRSVINDEFGFPKLPIEDAVESLEKRRVNIFRVIGK